MRTKWVLVGYGIFYLTVAISFLPTDRILSPQIEGAREIFPALIFAAITTTSIALVEAMTPLAALSVVAMVRFAVHSLAHYV